MSWLLPALTFAAGVALGAVVVAVGNTGGGGNGGAASRAVESAEPGAIDPSPSRRDLIVQVPGVCLEAIDAAEAATREVDDLVEAVRDFDAARLQELVDRFQQLESTTRESADRCRAVSGERLQDGTLVVPSLTPAP